MKITRRIKKYFVMAAAVLAVVIGVQSVSVPIGIVNAVQESSVADIVADEVEEVIEYPDYGTYSIWHYKALESTADLPKDYAHVLLMWDNYVLPINTDTLRVGTRHPSYDRDGSHEIISLKSDIEVGGEYCDMLGYSRYDVGSVLNQPKEYSLEASARMTGIPLSNYPDMSIDKDEFFMSEKKRTLNPGYLKGTNLYVVNEKGERIKLENKSEELAIYLPWYHTNKERHGCMMACFGPYPGSFSIDFAQPLNFYSAGGKGWYYILDYNSGGTQDINNKDNNYMIHDGAKVRACLGEDIKNLDNRKFKIFVGEEKKFTSIPDYTVTESFNITAGKYGDADGGTDKTDGIAIPPGVTLTVKKGAILTVSGNLLNNGTILNYGTIVIQNGGCIAPFRPGSTPSKNGCGTIKCIGGDIVILKGGALYAGMNDNKGADVPFYLDSNSTLINKGLLVYGTMNLGQSARLDLHEGSKTYGSWYIRVLNCNTIEGANITIPWSEWKFERSYMRSMNLNRAEKLKYMMDWVKKGYEREGLVLVRYSEDYTIKEYQGYIELFLKEMVLGAYVTLEQLDFPSVFNDFFMKEDVNEKNVPQMGKMEKLSDTSFGLCVNENATGKYAPHILKTKNAYINDPNMDTSVKAEAMIL